MKSNSGAKLSKRIKWLLGLGIAVFLYTVIGFFVVPAVVKAQMLKRLPALTKRQVGIERVKFNPYVLSLTIDGFSLKETDGSVFSSFGELYVNFQLSSIFKRAWVFDEISLRDPFGQIIYLKDGAFNFANLIDTNTPPAPASPPSPPPAVMIYHLLITNGAVAFQDLTRKSPFEIRYQPININLTDFTTRRDQSSPYEIVATGDSGESFGWMGNITVNPLRSSGTFRLTGLKLAKYQPYSQDYALFKIEDGQLDVSSDYKYDSTTNALDLEVSNAAVTLSNFKLRSPDPAEEVVSIPSLSITQISASVARRAAEVGQIKSSGGSVLVRQNKDGGINLLANLVPQPKATVAVSNPPAGTPWTARIGEISFDNYTINAEDQVPAKPAQFKIDQLAFNLKNVSNVSNASVAVALSLRLQDTGTIGLNGATTLMPPSADVLIGVTNLDLRMVQSYLDEQLKMAITRGALNVNGHAHYAAGGAGVTDFAGDVSVRNFGVADEVRFEDLATWDSLDVTGIKAGLQPFQLQIDRINVIRPSTSAILGPDHRFNFLTILPPKKAGPAESNAPSAAATPPAGNALPLLAFGEFSFDKASLHFADRSIEPNCTFDIQESSGSIKNVSSLLQTPSDFEVKGKVDEFSPFRIAGKLNPMPDKLFADVTVDFTNTGLTAFSPYTEVYVGRPLQKGKLSLDLHYAIDHRALNASNDVFIDQLTLGAKNGSTNATSLPIKLAIALFKDRNGRIKLDVPVHGTLDDPKFKVMPIVWGVIRNLLVKAATSPFSLLGAMFGGGEELSYVTFDPGQTNLPAAETNKLNTLTKALFERPSLSLEINGMADPVKDSDVMARAKFDLQIKTLAVAEMTAAGKPPIAAEDAKLEPAEYERLLAVAYSNAFGAYQPAGTNQATNAIAPPAAQKAASTPPENTGVAAVSPFRHAGAKMVRWPRGTAAAAGAATPPPAGIPIAQSDLDAMKERLLQKIEISSDDFRQLQQDRAKEVEKYLLQSGKVTADRLFITAPKPVSPNGKGEPRVNLTLD